MFPPQERCRPGKAWREIDHSGVKGQGGLPL
jgi:hypothetical protein